VAETPPIRRVVVITNKQGLHARPAEKLVRTAQKFDAKVELIRDDRRVDARNMIDLLTLGAGQGTQLVLEAEGREAQAAVDALAELVEQVFPQEDLDDQPAA
jgi:phosphotransferase system HPr (HPr) family protein